MAFQGVREWNLHGVPVGTDEDKALRKKAAQTEPAWKDVGKEAGMLIWQVEESQGTVHVVPWDHTQYGKFYKGDSYIVLQSEQDEENAGVLHHHIYFWLGEASSTDEKGTAAFKTFELDDLLGGATTQSREVQGKESMQFKALFPKLTYLEGGVESSFHHTGPDAYVAKLLHIRKTSHGVVKKEVIMSRSSLNQGDCFVLDAGRRIYIFIGDEAQSIEKYEANQAANRLKAERHGRATVTWTLDQGFWDHLGGQGSIKKASMVTDSIPPLDVGQRVLFFMDYQGERIIQVARGVLKKSMLHTNRIMILHCGTELFMWVGKAVADVGIDNAFLAACFFLEFFNKDEHTPIHIYKEGNKISNQLWLEAFSDSTSSSSLAPLPDLRAASFPVVDKDDDEPVDVDTASELTRLAHIESEIRVLRAKLNEVSTESETMRLADKLQELHLEQRALLDAYDDDESVDADSDSDETVHEL